jgi:hypothetical protein
MRTVVEHNYSYFNIFKMWGHAGSLWRWDMDNDQLADAAYYKGALRMVDAHDKTIIGTVFRGFVEFRKASQHLSRFKEYQRCVNDVDTEWFCLHGEGCELDVSFLALAGTATLPIGTSLAVLEGSVNAQLPDSTVTLGAMHHLKPREFEVSLEGNAKAFLIKQGPHINTKATRPGPSTPVPVTSN